MAKTADIPDFKLLDRVVGPRILNAALPLRSNGVHPVSYGPCSDRVVDLAKAETARA